MTEEEKPVRRYLVTTADDRSMSVPARSEDAAIRMAESWLGAWQPSWTVKELSGADA